MLGAAVIREENAPRAQDHCALSALVEPRLSAAQAHR